MNKRPILRVAELVRLEESQVKQGQSSLPASVSLAWTRLPVGTLLTLEARRRWWDLRPRRLRLRALDHLMAGFIRQEHVHVVAAALIRDGRVLAAQRSHPAELAGQWEFPGGKVEKGETLPMALARECQEELGLLVDVGPELARNVLPDGAVLVLFEVSLAPGSPEPQRLEHQALEWVDAARLDSLAWLPANRRFLPDVTSRL
ncbi:MAG: hypothetical protein JWO63_278 [Frankiales bacterium]|nr:hypothetical protein [Frankiales bacterium]